MATRQQFDNIYDEFRTLTLNKEYYARRLGRARRILRALDIFLALFAAGSAVLSFAFWNAQIFGLPLGPSLLSFATGAALVLGIARPYLKLEDELERLSSIQGAYSAVTFVMEDVVTRVKTQQNVDSIAEGIYTALRQVRGSLGAKEDAPTDRKLIAEMQAVVNQRYPFDQYFYYPDEKASQATSREVPAVPHAGDA